MDGFLMLLKFNTNLKSSFVLDTKKYEDKNWMFAINATPL